MRTATAAVVTGVATFAIGGMLAFCRADGGPADGAERVAVPATPEESTMHSVAESAPDPEASPPVVRRWGDPEPEAIPQASAMAAELAAIRERVGTAVPQDWQAFGVAVAAEEQGFERSIETLEGEQEPPDGRSDLTVPVPAEFGPEDRSSQSSGAAEVPPILAGSAEGLGIPFKPSRYGHGTDPGAWDPAPWSYPAPHPEILPFESPEALAELTKLLSASARDLERMAHVREEQRRYEDADRLRRLAMQLRRENRRLLPEPTPNPAYAGPAVGRR